jgi:Rrf2 family protein
MGANSRMTAAVHILSYLVLVSRKRTDPVTSRQIAQSVRTNPVVIRRLLGLLRKRGLVRSQRGANAGWRLARSPKAISLLDVYSAVHEDPLFGLHASPPNPQCPIGRGLPSTLRKVYGTLEADLRRQLARTSVDEVLARTLD